MLSFSNIPYLAKQHAFIKNKLKSKAAVFLVGGCVRNILLDIDSTPNDIDVTLCGNPKEIYNHSNKVGLSHFMTEKFGTITFIKKSLTNNAKISPLQYEITPLRTESEYTDFRHPEAIHRSKELLLDAKRRDFTINSLYFFAEKKGSLTKNKKIKKAFSDKELLQGLKKHGIYAIQEHNLLIIQNHDIITTLFQDGIYHKERLATILETAELGDYSEFNYFIIDPNQGIQDMFARKLRAVGDPDHRFQEDALRVLRALRFVNVINNKLKHKKSDAHLFDFDKPTRNAVKRNHKLLNHIAKERIKDELVKVFAKGDPFGFVALLDESHLLETIFPAVYATKNIHQPVRYHPFDVYTHMLLTLYELQKINSDYLVRFAMLYHDVGKVAQFSAYKEELSKDEIREILSGPLNHRKGGPELVKKDFSELGFSNKEIEQIARYVENHHKPEEILSGDDTDQCKKKLRKFLSEAGHQAVENILDITIADRRGQYNPLQNNSDLEEITYLRKLLHQLHKEEGQFTIKQLDLDGDEIMKHFKITPSKLVGELLKKGFDWTLNDIKKRNKKKEILIYLSGYLKNRKEEKEENEM